MGGVREDAEHTLVIRFKNWELWRRRSEKPKETEDPQERELWYKKLLTRQTVTLKLLAFVLAVLVLLLAFLIWPQLGDALLELLRAIARLV